MPALRARWTMDVAGREKGSSLYWVLKVAVPRMRGVSAFEGGERGILNNLYDFPTVNIQLDRLEKKEKDRYMGLIRQSDKRKNKFAPPSNRRALTGPSLT